MFIFMMESGAPKHVLVPKKFLSVYLAVLYAYILFVVTQIFFTQVLILTQKSQKSQKGFFWRKI